MFLVTSKERRLVNISAVNGAIIVVLMDSYCNFLFEK